LDNDYLGCSGNISAFYSDKEYSSYFLDNRKTVVLQKAEKMGEKEGVYV